MQENRNFNSLRMKRFRIFLLVAIIGLSFSANAQGILVNGIYYNFDSYNSTAEVTSGPTPEYAGDIVIPSAVSYDGTNYTVTSIQGGAFYGCGGLVSITIPNTLVNFGAYFSGCPNFVHIYVDNANPNFSEENGVLFNKDKTKLIRFPQGKTGDYNVQRDVD